MQSAPRSVLRAPLVASTGCSRVPLVCLSLLSPWAGLAEQSSAGRTELNDHAACRCCIARCHAARSHRAPRDTEHPASVQLQTAPLFSDDSIRMPRPIRCLSDDRRRKSDSVERKRRTTRGWIKGIRPVRGSITRRRHEACCVPSNKRLTHSTKKRIRAFSPSRKGITRQ